MDFTIHSIGDSAFLESILNVVAMLHVDNDLAALASVGLLLGILIVFIQSVFQGAKEINIQQIVVCWIIYACFFVPTTTVHIEDGYTGQVRTVDNVPIAVGFAGGIISEIGYQLTVKFETAFGPAAPSITTNHFAESLKLLNQVRRKSFDSMIFVGMNEALGGGYVDVRKSWMNYIRECTLTKVDLGLASVEDVMTSKINDAFQFNSSLFGTKLYLTPTNPNGTDYTCTEAYAELTAKTNSSIGSAQVQQVMQNLFGDGDGTGPALTSVWDQVGDALDSLGAATTATTDYMKAAVLEPLYYEAAEGRYQDLQDYTSALMINQAVQQRNTQWAAEQTMFMSVVRPMMTFFEGFIYAITPIMAFIIVLGGFGITLATKYLQTLIWIQLWMPVLSIINLFIYNSASGDMASYAAAGLDSMYTLNGATDVLQNWVATGGMLAAATPIISLFIVTGSTYTFTTLASRISGSDHVDEKMQSPDVLDRGALAKMQPYAQGNEFSGLQRSGTESFMQSMNLANSVSSAATSAHQQATQTQESFGNTLASGVKNSTGQQQMFSRLSSLGRSFDSNNSQASQAVRQTAKSFMDDFGISNEHSDAVQSALALHAAGKITTPELVDMLSPLQGGAGVEGRGTSQGTDAKKMTAGSVSKMLDQSSLAKTDSASLMTSLAAGFENKGGETFSDSWGSDLSKQLSHQAQAVTSSADTYSTLDQMQASVGKMQRTDFKSLGASVAGNKQAQEKLNGFMNTQADSGMKGRVATLQQRYEGYGMSADVARNAAILTAMTNPSNYSDSGKSLDGMRTAFSAIGSATGQNFGGLASVDPAKNAGMAGPHVDADGLRNAATGATTPARNLSFNTRGAKNTANTDPVSTPVHAPSSAPQVITDDHANGTNTVDQAASANTGAASAKDRAKTDNLMIAGAPDMYTGTSMFGAWDNMGTAASSVGEAGKEGAKAAANSFGKYFDDLNNISEEKLDYINNTWGGKFDQYQDDQATIREYGSVAGGALNGMKHLGNNLVGAAVTGMAYAKGLMGDKELYEKVSQIPNDQLGAMTTAALRTAASEGVERFQEVSSGLEKAFTQKGLDMGLTQEQAEVFGAAHNPVHMMTDLSQRAGSTLPSGQIAQELASMIPGIPQGAYQSDSMTAAENRLRDTFAERDEHGKIMRDQDGRAILSEHNEKVFGGMVDILESAPRAGEQEGAYVSSVRGWNIAHKGLER